MAKNITIRLLIRNIFLFVIFINSQSFASDKAMKTTELHEAAKQNDVKILRNLLTQNELIDARDTQGRTALLIATHNNNIEAAKVLIEAGADVNAKDDINDSPYLYAGARGHNEILKLTLAHGANLKSTNRYGGTALIPASERGHIETVRILIKAGVDVNHVNNLGWTALIEAIILGDGSTRFQEIVKTLIGGGADVNLPDGKGQSPLDLAKQHGYEEIAQILLNAGAR